MTEIATLAAGCFWCYEPIFQKIDGVEKIAVGYSGGHTENPTYETVCDGNTGHAEAFQIEFDNSKVSFEGLLEIFFKMHDPTTLNRQGNDVGTQYRSAIFYHSDEQKNTAEEVIKRFANDFTDPIVTEVVEFKKFWSAEDYHQDFYNKNRNYPYCKLVIEPKIMKFERM